MFDRDVAKPRYWKAFLAAALFLAPLALILRAATHMPALVWLVIYAGVVLLCSATVYARMQNDWRATGVMRNEQFYKRTTVGRSVTIRKR